MIKTPLSTVIGGAFWTPKAMILSGTSKTFDQIIKSLFANGEQGFVYDPNDLSTMFQDAAGTVPVTGVGQPVGLILDKSKGLALGAERLTYGDFSQGLVGWSVSAQDTTHTITPVVNGVRYLSDTTIPVLSLTHTKDVLTVGKWYKITITVSDWVSGSIKTDNFLQPNFQLAASAGTFTYYDQAISSRFAILRNSSKVDLVINSISIKEVTGNHAYQTTSASRPILRQNATTGAYYLEFDGSDDFLQTSNIDFTTTDKVSLFVGVRKLSDVTQIIAELSGDSNYRRGSFYIVAGSDYGGIGYTSFGNGTNGWSSEGTARNFTYLAPDTAVLSAKHDISGDLSSMRRNGVVGIDGTFDKGTGNFGNHPLYIGRREGTKLPFNGHIYGLIGIGKLTSDSETTAIEKELAKRTGVTLSV